MAQGNTVTVPNTLRGGINFYMRITTLSSEKVNLLDELWLTGKMGCKTAVLEPSLVVRSSTQEKRTNEATRLQSEA